MKNLSIILNVVLLIAVAFLFYKVYSVKPEQPVVVSKADKMKASIVYVNSDTLLENYPLLKDLETAYNHKRDSVDDLLSTRDRSLKQEAADFEQRAAMMTEEQQKQQYDNLMRKQNALLKYRDDLMKHLSDEQDRMQDSIHSNLLSFLKEYNKAKGYDYILGYQRGGGILLADDSLNITNEVLEGLKKK